MTTTEQLREYLDAHGVDGAPTEPGWYVVSTVATVVVVFARQAEARMFYTVGGEDAGWYLHRLDIVRRAPLTLAPPASRDLDDCTPQAEIAKAAASLAMATARLSRVDSSTQRIQWSEEVGIWSKRLSELRAAHARDLDAETVAGVQAPSDEGKI